MRSHRYEGMGRAAVHCRGGCRCAAQQLEGHVTNAALNATVWAKHEWHVTFCRGRGRDHEGVTEGGEEGGGCALRLRVLRSTASAGHKVKVRSLIVHL